MPFRLSTAFSEVTNGGELVTEVDTTSMSVTSLRHASIQVVKTPIVKYFPSVSKYLLVSRIMTICVTEQLSAIGVNSLEVFVSSCS